MFDSYTDDIASDISDREMLEKEALQAVSAIDYYDLADTMSENDDEMLMKIIKDGKLYNYKCLCGVDGCDIWGQAEHEKVEEVQS
jgi:hypothetical protein